MQPSSSCTDRTDSGEFVQVANDGTFARRGLRPGMYCFKVSAPGARSIVGRFVLDWRARMALELVLREAA